MTESVEDLIKLYGPAASTESMAKPSSSTPKHPKSISKKKERKDRADAEAAAILAASPLVEGESSIERFTQAMALYQSKVGLVPTIPPATPPMPRLARSTNIKDYSPQQLSTLLRLVADGYSLNRICMRDDMPERVTIREWALENPTFYSQYARAREHGLHTRAENMRDEIATNPDPVRAKLLFEHDKWYLAKMMPKTYGERSELHTTQVIEHKHTIDVSQLSHEAMEALEGALVEAKALPSPTQDVVTSDE